MRGTIFAVLILCFVPVFAAAAAEAPQGQPYHLEKKIVLGGPGGWDYFEVDSNETHRVFIPRGVDINVVEANGMVVGTIPTPNGSHGLVFAPEFGRGFTAEKDGSLLIFDPKTLKVIGEEKPPETRSTDFVLYDPGSKRVFTFNPRSKDATAFDAQTGKFVGFIDLGGQLEAGQADGKGRVYVLLINTNEMVEFDSKALKVLNKWSIAPCIEPHGLAIDRAHRRLFTGCRGNFITTVIDYRNRKTVATIPIGKGTDSNQFDPSSQLVFSSCADGTINVAHEDTPDKYTVVQTIVSQKGARTMALDTKNHNVYAVTPEFSDPNYPGYILPPPPDQPNVRGRQSPPLPDTFSLLIFSK
jgi:DNA-binding beta-propeller fold protein YncE